MYFLNVFLLKIIKIQNNLITLVIDYINVID